MQSDGGNSRNLLSMSSSSSTVDGIIFDQIRKSRQKRTKIARKICIRRERVDGGAPRGRRAHPSRGRNFKK